MDTQSNTTPISFTKSNKILQWLPSRGNVIFTVVLVVMMSWMQASGVFATNAASPIAATNINRAIPYQGRLADNVGNPLTATYPMIFRLYSESSGSVPLWEEQWTGPNNVAVSDGLFNVMLGSLTPILQSVLTDNGNLWLGITVGTDDEMQPRVQLGNVPYAVQAQTVAENSVSSAHIVDGSIEYVDFGPDAIPPDVPV